MSSFLHTDVLNHTEKNPTASRSSTPTVFSAEYISNNPYPAVKPATYATKYDRPAILSFSMFKAILSGLGHSLSDPELEYSLITNGVKRKHTNIL